MESVKKLLLPALVLALLLSLAGCAGNLDSVTVDYGDSAVHTQEEIDQAVRVVKDTFRTFNGCTLHSLSYAGDERAQAELDYYNAALENAAYISCIVLNSSFHSPKKGGGASEPDTEYTWDWILAKESGGDWILIAYGYG